MPRGNEMSMNQVELSKIETGKIAITFGYLVKVARWFGMGPEEVLRRSGAPYAPASCSTSNIGEIIRSRRISNQLSLRELGRMIGDTHPGIARIEKKCLPKAIKVELIVVLDKALGFNGELVGMVWDLVAGSIDVDGDADHVESDPLDSPSGPS